MLLAAGRGERFGGGKLTADLRGRPLWKWAAEAAQAIDFAERILVVAPGSALRARPDWMQVENPDAPTGMGSSIAAGVAAVSACEQVVIMLADMPFVTPDHLARLAGADGPAFSSYERGIPGCPAAFPQSAFAQLRGLKGERGARSLELGEISLISPSDGRELADIDTVRDLEELASDTQAVAPPKLGDPSHIGNHCS